MRNRKGLSNLVATVLIVLLALAAVAIVWGFLRPMFENVGGEINKETECISAEVEGVTCTYSNSVEDPDLVTVRGVARLKGGEVDGIRLIASDVDGDSVAYGDVLDVAPLASVFLDGSVAGTVGTWAATIDITDYNGGNSPEGGADYTDDQGNPYITKLEVAPIVSDDDGNSDTCTPTSIPCNFVEDCSTWNLGLCDADECGVDGTAGLPDYTWCGDDDGCVFGDDSSSCP